MSARADWIAFLDSDDYWLLDTLSARLAYAEASFASDSDALTVHAAGFILENSFTKRKRACIPRESGDPLDFASGCWFAPGSTLLARKEAFDHVGLFDIELRRLEDLDWALRLALSGGRLKVWSCAAAVLERGSQFPAAHLHEAAGYLSRKYLAQAGFHRLPSKLARRLRAYLDIERAALDARQRRWLGMLFYLGRSFCRVPRVTLYLARFWRFEPPPGIDPPSPVGLRTGP